MRAMEVCHDGLVKQGAPTQGVVVGAEGGRMGYRNYARSSWPSMQQYEEASVVRPGGEIES